MNTWLNKDEEYVFHLIEFGKGLTITTLTLQV